jgi:hypothetical protein
LYDYGPRKNVITHRVYWASQTTYFSGPTDPNTVIDANLYALEFNAGHRIDIDIPESVQLGDEWSIEFWSRMDASNSGKFFSQPDCEKGLHVELNVYKYEWYPDYPNRKFQVLSESGNAVNTWYKYRFINDPANSQIYIESVRNDWKTFASETPIEYRKPNFCKGTPLIIGEDLDLDLKMSDLRFYNRISTQRYFGDASTWYYNTPLTIDSLKKEINNIVNLN